MKKIFTAFMMMLCAVCAASAANYLTFTAEEDSSTFGIAYNYFEPDVQYSLNGGETWTELAVGDTILLAKKGDKAHIRGYNEGGLSDGKADVHFVMTGAIAASGSVMSLIDGSGSSTEIPCSYCFIELFSGCTGLTKAPELPATTLDRGCYAGMFQDCTSLTQAPELPATSLSNYCYNSMFRGCTSLTQAPELPAMTLANSCYSSMFSGCTSLTQAPELPATEMTFYCYNCMFSGCTSLTQAPELPATTLAEYCYNRMFSGCTSLTQAPELPATEMTFYCYSGMFLGCTSLTQAPELPAKEFLGKYSYSGMFSGCTSLSEINVSFDDWDKLDATFEWVADVAPTGTFICPKTLPLEYGISRIPEGWTVKYIEDEANYLTFTAEEDGSTFGIVNNGGNNPDVQYSLDGGETWTALAGGKMVTLAHKGDKALLRGDNPEGFSKGNSKYSSFTMTGKIAASGSVMSLIDGVGLSTEIPKSYCFWQMFENCTSLTQSPELPATNLAIGCYYEMFSGCTGLTQAPELPATTLARYCYEGMFSGCTSLAQAPALPATSLAGGCYYKMFSGCTSLSEINVSFTSWLGTEEWVKDVAPTGTFICPKALPLEYGVDRIPEGWMVKYIDDTVAVEANYLTFTAEEDGSSFGIINEGGNNPDVQYSLDGGKTWTALAVGDTVILAHKGDKALLKGNNPEGFSKYWDQYSCFRMTGKVAANGSVMSLIDGLGLSTEIPGEFCFRNLFSDCTSLTQAPELPATTLTGNCYESMFSGCTSLTQAPALPATTLTEKCYDRMFSGCASLTRAPELPATTLAEACYEGMFQECTSLTQAPALPATTLPTVSNVKGGCYIFMFSGCTSLSRIRVSFDDWNDGLHTLAWVADVAPTGTFICPKDLPLEYGVDRIPEGWTVKYIDDTVAVEANYLTFTAEEDGSTFGIINEGGNNPDVQYSLDGGETWTALAAGVTITLAHKGDKALLRGDNPEGFSKGKYEFSTFKLTGKVAASGSVMSLIDGVGISTEIPGEFCFRAMFLGCTSLTQAPELPATILADNCYWGMFYHCTSLTQAPELPATTLAEGCYYEMFSGCTSLSEIKVPFDDWNRGDYTAEWVIDVAPTGTFICPKALALEYGWESIPEGWTVKYIEDMANYLTFTAEEDGSSFGIVNNGGNNPDVQYSLDGGETWNILAEGDSVILVHKGDKALLRGNNPEGFSKSWEQYSTFKMTGKVTASGSIMSLIDGVGISTEVPGNYCFYKLFQGCTSLTQAPELPATTLAYSCYRDMFDFCTSLTQAPKLPATTLAEACYFGMFASCTSLTQAPELPATTLPTTSNVENGCYSLMFLGCTSLTQAPELPATTLAEGCYTDMFYGCTSLTQAPKLPATTLADFCYFEMFSGCTSLTQAPELPATTLTDFCYDRMFSGCTSLTQAPELPAKEFLGKYSYSGMFSGCTSLSEINVSFATWSDYYSNTDGWVKDVAPTGTFICPKELPLEYGVSRIPEGWTVKYIEGEGSGVNSALSDNITVWTDDLTVHVCGAEGEVSLYDVSGKRVAVSNSADEERALNVPSKGVYVLRANGGSSVVLVR